MNVGFLQRAILAAAAALVTAHAAWAQVPSGERDLGQSVVEPAYDYRTGDFVYLLTPQHGSGSVHANANAVSTLFLVVYPGSAAGAVAE